MATVTVVTVTAATTAVVRVCAVVLAVDGGRDAVTVQVRVAQTVRGRNDDGRLCRLQRVLVIVLATVLMMVLVMVVVMLVVVVWIVTTTTDVGR